MVYIPVIYWPLICCHAWVTASKVTASKVTASDIRRLLRERRQKSLNTWTSMKMHPAYLNNDNKRLYFVCVFFVSDISTNTIYSCIHSFIHSIICLSFTHVFVLELVIHKLGIWPSWSGVILTCPEHHCALFIAHCSFLAWNTCTTWAKPSLLSKRHTLVAALNIF